MANKIQIPDLPLSVVVISRKADEHFVPDLLRSLPDGCELIILWNERGDKATEPTCSKDEIVAGRHIKYYDLTYTERYPSFAWLRNVACSFATREWILWIDSDERIPLENREWFARHLHNYPAGVGGLMVGVYGVQCATDNKGAALRSNTGQVRLIRNHGFIFSGHAHEQIGWCIQDNGFAIVDTSLLIHHVGYRTDADTMRRKMERNVHLLARTVYECDDAERRMLHLDLLVRDAQHLIALSGDK